MCEDRLIKFKHQSWKSFILSYPYLLKLCRFCHIVFDSYNEAAFCTFSPLFVNIVHAHRTLVQCCSMVLFSVATSFMACASDIFTLHIFLNLFSLPLYFSRFAASPDQPHVFFTSSLFLWASSICFFTRQDACPLILLSLPLFFPRFSHHNSLSICVTASFIRKYFF